MALTVTVEVPPLHRIGEGDELGVRADGIVMVTELLVFWQCVGVLLSCTVTVCEPAPTLLYCTEHPSGGHGLVPHGAKEPLSSLHSYGGVPPEKFPVIVPKPVLQAGSCPVAETTKPALKET